MNIAYVANMRLPTEKAHGIQIMKACEAFVREGSTVALIVPRRKTPITESPFVYYGLKTDFPIRKLWTLDTVGFGKIGFVLQSVLFAIRVRMSLPAYDILYGRDEIVLAVLALLGAPNIVWESHDGSWNRWARILAHRMKGLVVVSNGARDIYIKRGVKEECILATPNGIDLKDFAEPEDKASARMRLRLPLDALITMYIGRLDGWKGSDTFLSACDLLPSSIVPVVIGGEDAQIKRLASAHTAVRFLGFRPYRELRDNQSAADVLVVPNTATDPISTTFTSPLKLFAHMASNRPVIASDLPSIREIAGDTVYLVEPDNAEALKVAIEGVFANPDESNQRAEQARERVQSFSWDRRAERLTSFLNTLH